MKVFKTKKEEFQYRKDNFLTVGKLKDYLNQFTDDTLIYVNEHNTGTWQCVPTADYIFITIKDEKIRYKKILKNWYEKVEDKDHKIKEEIKDTFRYVYGKDGLCISL